MMANKEETIHFINTRKNIGEFEAEAQILFKLTNSVVPSANFTKEQNQAIADMKSGLRYWIGIHLGELKNEFGIGLKQALET